MLTRSWSISWKEALTGALGNLPVKIIQGTSDEGKGLINHVTKGLKGHHSPDLFHVMYEISKGTSAPLSSLVRKAEKAHEDSANAVDDALNIKTAYENLEKRPVGRAPDFEKRISRCREKETEARASLQLVIDNRETVSEGRKNISRIYHPYDPLTGNKQDASTVGRLLEKNFDEIRHASDSLGDKSKERIEKAWRVTEKMTATIAFFFCMIESLVKDMNVSHDKQELMYNRLIPGFYLEKVYQKEADPERKDRIRQKSLELLSVLTDRSGPLSGCDEMETNRMVRKAKDYAGIFQRSSSCVEGRNAQLSLRHHGMHRLSNRKLKCLTVIHNFYLKRSDGTTAAERFFESKPSNMFDWLLNEMDSPPRPRSKRKLAA